MNTNEMLQQMQQLKFNGMATSYTEQLQLPIHQQLEAHQLIAQLMQEDRILITKDNNFYYSYVAARRPVKLVLVKLGNMRLRELKSYFERNAGRIIELLREPSFLVLERENIRVLE